MTTIKIQLFCGSLQGDILPVKVIYREKLEDVIHILNFNLDGMSYIPPIIGQQKQPCYNILST